MKLISSAAVAIAACALNFPLAGTAVAAELPPTSTPYGTEGRALLGACGVQYRMWVDHNPERPGTVTLNLQGVNTYGPGENTPGGCDAFVNYYWFNVENPLASSLWLYNYAPVHATKNGGTITSVELPTGSGTVAIVANGTNQVLAVEQFLSGSYVVP